MDALAFRVQIIGWLALVLLLPVPVDAVEPEGDVRAEIAAPVLTEGEFAARLAHALDLPMPERSTDEEAARALRIAGVEPARGWRLDYPMTPDIVAELGQDVMEAVNAGRLPRDSALQAFDDTVAEAGLPVPTEPPPGYAAAPPPSTNYIQGCADPALYDYYGQVGPPIYTYCPPPPAYLYMYTWFPGSYVWYGRPFAGFFVLKDVHVLRRHPHGFRSAIVPPHRFPHDKRYTDVIRPAPGTRAPIPHDNRDRRRGEEPRRFDNGSSYRRAIEPRPPAPGSRLARPPVSSTPGVSRLPNRSGFGGAIAPDRPPLGARPGTRSLPQPAVPRTSNEKRWTRVIVPPGGRPNAGRVQPVVPMRPPVGSSPMPNRPLSPRVLPRAPTAAPPARPSAPSTNRSGSSFRSVIGGGAAGIGR